MLIRSAVPADMPELGQVFYAAVRQGHSPYNEAQRAAWVSEPPEGTAWADRLAALHMIVAQDAKEIAGFMSVEPGGYIDLAFIRPQHQGTGLFRALYDRVERWARARNEPRLWTHASLMAQPAFQAMGFLVTHHETVQRHGQDLTRAKMEKALT